MILYHFTDFNFLESGGTILQEGLKPAMEKQGAELPPYGVVCSDPTRHGATWPVKAE